MFLHLLVKLLLQFFLPLLDDPLLLRDHVTLKLNLVLLGRLFGLSFGLDLLLHAIELLHVLVLLLLHIVLHLRQLLVEISLNLSKGGIHTRSCLLLLLLLLRRLHSSTWCVTLINYDLARVLKIGLRRHRLLDPLGLLRFRLILHLLPPRRRQLLPLSLLRLPLLLLKLLPPPLKVLLLLPLPLLLGPLLLLLLHRLGLLPLLLRFDLSLELLLQPSILLVLPLLPQPLLLSSFFDLLLQDLGVVVLVLGGGAAGVRLLRSWRPLWHASYSVAWTIEIGVAAGASLRGCRQVWMVLHRRWQIAGWWQVLCRRGQEPSWSLVLDRHWRLLRSALVEVDQIALYLQDSFLW